MSKPSAKAVISQLADAFEPALRKFTADQIDGSEAVSIMISVDTLKALYQVAKRDLPTKDNRHDHKDRQEERDAALDRMLASLP